MAELTNSPVSDTGSSASDDSSFGVVTPREATVDSTIEPEKVATVTEVEAKEEAPKEQIQEAPTEEKVVLTEKGTKLDPNPLSAVHQQLANEKAKARQMEQILTNPDLLAQYMKTRFPEPVKEQEVKTYKPEDFQNIDDVAKVVNELQNGFATKSKTYEEKIQQLSTAVQNLLQGGQAARLANTMSEDVASLRSKPELDPKSSDFIEGLEDDIASMYHKLDFDEQTGTFKGNYSLREIGERMISAAQKARKNGSLKAQTIVKDKSEGKIVTSPKVKEETSTDNLSAGDSIAAGISKLFK